MQSALVDLLCHETDEGAARAEEAGLCREHGFAFWDALASVLKGAQVQRGLAPRDVRDRARLGAMQATGTRFFSAYAYAFLAEGHLCSGALAEGSPRQRGSAVAR